jgi:hypothetical protein
MAENEPIDPGLGHIENERLCPSERPDAKRARYQKWKDNKNSKKGILSFNYRTEDDKAVLMGKLTEVKTFMGEGKPSTVTTFEVLHRIMDFYLSSNIAADEGPAMGDDQPIPEYQVIGEEETEDEELYVCTLSSVQHLLAQTQQHNASECKSFVAMSFKNRLHHVLRAQVECPNCTFNCMWTSTPHIPGGKFLGNVRVAHGYLTSGILPNQYEKLCTAAQLGVMGDTYLNALVDVKHDTSYHQVVANLTKESLETAMLEEVAAQELATEDATEGIDILTDALLETECTFFGCCVHRAEYT